MYSEYSAKAVKDWLHRTIGIDNQPTPDEVQTHCPECGKPRFYFNVRKGVGVCHHAECHFTPTLDDLIAKIGFAPDESGEWEKEEEDAEPVVEVPGHPILRMENGQLLTSDVNALTYLRNRGITDQIILNWGLTSTGERVYVPIYHEGALRNYNSRLLPSVRDGGVDDGDGDVEGARKYLYSPGAKTSYYILGWEECQLWDRLALVENTFVSLCYRSDLHCSTTFGSNVSDVQADLISGGSNIRIVALLWDEGAEKGASRSARKLNDQGIPAAYWRILGQPDDYPKDWVLEKAELVFKAAREGVRYVDLKEECHEFNVRNQ